MTILRVVQILGVLGLVLSTGVVLTGYAPGSPARETVPESVRDNPSAWRPIYVGGTGYHPVPTNGGGFSFGK